MSTDTCFAARFTLLKETYPLSYAQLASVFGISAKSAVNEWASAKKWPNGTMLKLISNVFGVSLDWMLGNINTPYREDLTLRLEENIALPFYKKALSTVGGLSILPTEYEKADLRGEYYSLGQRANLIFAALSTCYWAEHEIEILKSSETPEITSSEYLQSRILISFAMMLMEDKDFYFNVSGRKSTSLNSIGKLLRGELDHPIYDLEKAIANAKNV
ncbi:helix-turn-helix domain-containing protein [Acidaminococcus fermentans]|uniref:helix-turn-helix domain-containing protein n=1 Tax=Acidaminococcus fermentans TaxID=905 RepID=UPI00241F33E2|nr:helix-turn-helix transcriptional regulator [Acidaminococcus fermentans]